MVSAPSGAGKTTLVERIRRAPNLFYSVSCTTRAPRAGEIDGQDYRFLSDADFRERVEKGDFLEQAQVHGDHYGTLREPVVTNLESGKDVLIDIDTQGAAVIRNCGDPLIGDALADVFIMPPDLERIAETLAKPRNGNRRADRFAPGRRRPGDGTLARLSIYYYQWIGGGRFAEVPADHGGRKLFEPAFD